MISAAAFIRIWSMARLSIFFSFSNGLIPRQGLCPSPEALSRKEAASGLFLSGCRRARSAPVGWPLDKSESSNDFHLRQPIKPFENARSRRSFAHC